MKNIIYPAIFHEAADGGYWVEFPDLPGCYTEGDTLEEAFCMAGDALYAWFKEDSAQKAPTALTALTVQDGDIALLVRAAPYEL